ncbi:unnamed protein product [Caenorhabditis nigoni]
MFWGKVSPPFNSPRRNFVQQTGCPFSSETQQPISSDGRGPTEQSSNSGMVRAGEDLWRFVGNYWKLLVPIPGSPKSLGPLSRRSTRRHSRCIWRLYELDREGVELSACERVEMQCLNGKEWKTRADELVKEQKACKRDDNNEERRKILFRNPKSNSNPYQLSQSDYVLQISPAKGIHWVHQSEIPQIKMPRIDPALIKNLLDHFIASHS